MPEAQSQKRTSKKGIRLQLNLRELPGSLALASIFVLGLASGIGLLLFFSQSAFSSAMINPAADSKNSDEEDRYSGQLNRLRFEQPYQSIGGTAIWAFALIALTSSILATLGSITAAASVGSADGAPEPAQKEHEKLDKLTRRLAELENMVNQLKSRSLDERSSKGKEAVAANTTDPNNASANQAAATQTEVPQRRSHTASRVGQQIPISINEGNVRPSPPSHLEPGDDQPTLLKSSASKQPSKANERASGFAELIREQLIQVWEECQSDGRFHHTIVLNELQKAGLDFRVQPGTKLDLGDAVIAITSKDREELYLLPSFNDSPEAVAKWFHNQAPNARVARIDQLIKPALMKMKDGSYQLIEQGVVA